MTFDDTMFELSVAVSNAIRAAGNQDGAPEHALRELAAEIDCLIDHNCTRAELRDAAALYKGAKQAGLL